MVFDPRIRAGIFAGESGGDYDALFGFSNRPGGRFSNIKLTDMTVDQAIQFAKPGGEYANYVKGIKGYVATPMGGYQIVGDTLKDAKGWAKLTGAEKMSADIQDKLGQAILEQQGTGAWEGYRGPRDPSSVKAKGPASASRMTASAATNKTPMAQQKPALSKPGQASISPAPVKDWAPTVVVKTEPVSRGQRIADSMSAIVEEQEKAKNEAAWAWVHEAMQPKPRGPAFNVWGM